MVFKVISAYIDQHLFIIHPGKGILACGLERFDLAPQSFVVLVKPVAWAFFLVLEVGFSAYADPLHPAHRRRHRRRCSRYHALLGGVDEFMRCDGGVEAALAEVDVVARGVGAGVDGAVGIVQPFGG